jgi:hypothetical protein
MTVHSLGDGNISRRDKPREVNLDAGQMTLLYTLGSNGDIPTQYKGFSSYYFQFIDQGGESYCTARKNCAVYHYHGPVKIVKPGEIYVSKSSTMAFVTPSITKPVIDSEDLSGWRALSLTLPEWNKKFLIATATLDDTLVSTAAMEVHEEFLRTKALNFKTPS